ncbi:MAG: AAA family ATPase, partial [Halobacteria archaeon]
MQNKQIEKLYSFVSENLYFNIPDIQVEEKGYNSTLLLSLITALTGGKELIVGEPGLGKTTSAEYISCLIYQLPLDIIWDSEVEGHPEQTEEKIKGRPDLGELNIGREEVIWSNFTQLQPKIVDEINRLPPSKQSIILKGCDTGIWRYLDELLVNEEYCLFATANYSDRGTTELLPPLLDRFDVEVESKHPGAIFSSEINGRKK